MHDSQTELANIISVGEATFARRVRGAVVPVAVVFASARCAASRALQQALAPSAERFADQVLVLRVDVDRAPLLAEQYGVLATPTLLVLEHGEELTRMVGYAPEPLVRLLFEQVLAGELVPGRLWSPLELAFEDAVIIPLLDDWGWAYQRQVSCPRAAGRAAVRVDILAYAGDTSAPRTLFENKRQISSSVALQQALAQARSYAQLLQLAAFVVAAPSGLWIYRLQEERARLIQSFTILEVMTRPDLVKHTLQLLMNAGAGAL